ncbi:hypothetical protein LQ318_11495 [Aliifodinibius salicampi]|uniref:DUF4292 domain-containing protein n=1 Tax=Fodinibius salicampi TaxID=1920655 RepID=A0ABT3Q0B1_9BACT|nr:hypothetical protein [Fodinibius salicampi]MCW9713526.1 hypothetical protein [Fodinibius salicampi]
MNFYSHMVEKSLFIFICCGLLFLASCTGTQKLSETDYHSSTKDAKQVVNQLPSYSETLKTAEGKGRAIVSEPGNTERVTLIFASNRAKSLVTVRNSIGIQGGQLLTDGDTLLVYNKVDKYARKIPVRGGNLDHINRLASLNILDILNYTVNLEDVQNVLENDQSFQLLLSTGTKVFINKESHYINEIIQPEDSELPYSKIQYEGYTEINDYMLPRRITIFGAEQKSKIALQLNNLELNSRIDSLTIQLPDDIRIYHQ